MVESRNSRAETEPSALLFILVPQPIAIKDQAWLCADVFVGPGVIIEQGAVVGVRSSGFTDLPDRKACVAAPAKPHCDRVVRAAGPLDHRTAGPQDYKTTDRIALS